MTTIINTPRNDDGSSVVSLIVGIVVLLVVVGVFFVYALPAIRQSRVAPQKGNIDVNIKLPPVDVSPTPASPAQ